MIKYLAANGPDETHIWHDFNKRSKEYSLLNYIVLLIVHLTESR